MKNKETILRDGVSHHRIINGCWQLSQGHGGTEIKPLETIQTYIDAGFNCFDGADIYTGVEDIFGKIIAQNDCIRIHTKHVPDLDDVANHCISEQKTITQIMRSCDRMGVDCLDNVQFHWWDYDISGYDISIMTLMMLQKKGIISHIGITNTNVNFLKKIKNELGFIPMTTQNQYSILDRRPEKKLIEYISEHEIGLYCYGSLMGGLLSERYLGIEIPKEPLENRSLRKYIQIINDWGTWDLFQELLVTLKEIADTKNVTLSELAIAWVLNQKAVSSVILGVRNTDHIGSLEKILSVEFNSLEFNRIDKIYLKGLELSGDVFDLERYEPRHRDIMKFNLNKKS